MKLLLDANLPPQSAKRLQDLYPESQHVRGVSLRSADDTAIWNYAKREGFTIVSKDSDFYDRSILLGFPPKVIWLKLGNCSATRLETVLRENYLQIQHFETDTNGSCLIIL
jgi:predicted nuclease of predicted toxin-antitoxin system